MNWQQLRFYWKEQLNGLDEVKEIDQWFYLFLEATFGISRKDYLLCAPNEVENDTLKQTDAIIAKLLRHEPIQYALRKAWFHGAWYEVNTSVLIPRPETEELVQLAAQEMDKNKRLLDVGTGSGCIPIALKSIRPDLDIHSMDISDEAIKTAERNAQKIGAEVHFHVKSIFDEMDNMGSFDAIISNPPYIPISELEEMDNRVKDYEPHLALFIEQDDPLIFYREIMNKCRYLVNERGQLFFEIHEKYADDIVGLSFELLPQAKSNVLLDQFNRKRMIHIQL